MEIESWLLFSSIALVATITPGPAVLLVTSHSISHGPGRTIFTILGNISGLFFMSLLSVLGLGAIVLTSATAFTCIRIIGACYLIYLGIKLWRNGFLKAASSKKISSNGKRVSTLSLYLHGLMVALSNPKAIAFTTALFPQFIDHAAPLLPQFSVLVTTFMFYSFTCLFFYARLSAKTGTVALNSKRDGIISKIFATLFIGSGIGLAASS